MHIIKNRFFGWICRATKDELEYAKEIFDIFYIASKITDEEANIILSKLVNDKLYENVEWLNLYWSLSIKDHPPNDQEYLQKMIQSMKDDYKHGRDGVFINALNLVNELSLLCESERRTEIVNDAYGFISDVLDKHQDREEYVLSALHGILNFMDEKIEKDLVKKSLGTIIQLIGKNKDKSNIFDLILNVLAAILDPKYSHEYLACFEGVRGVEALFGVGKDEYLVKNESFLHILVFIASNEEYFEKYKDSLCKYTKMVDANSDEEVVTELFYTVNRTGLNDFDDIGQCTKNILGEYGGFQPFYICLNCNRDRQDMTFCKYCFETHHKGHKYVKMFGCASCDQSSVQKPDSLGEPPNKQPRIQE